MALGVWTDRGDGTMSPETFNKWRVMPRILMIAYYGFFAFTFWEISGWFMSFDWSSVNEPSVSLAVAGFPVGILGVLSAVLATLTKNYFQTGGPSGSNGG